MNVALDKLISSLQVEQLDKYLFRGFTPRPTLPRIYGGQVVAQAMNSALQTVSPDRVIHSLHAYFLRPGNPDIPILFYVDPVRDGGSFTSRRVVAEQNGKAIYNCSLSFQVLEQGFEHQDDMPDMPDPESLESETDCDNNIPDYNLIEDPAPFSAWDIRRTCRPDPINPEACDAKGGFWVRVKGELPNDLKLHQTLLAYISDYYMMTIAMHPHAVSFSTPGFQGASLDHAIWFHSPCYVDKWLLHAVDSPRAISGRGFSRGSFYTLDNGLVASTAQEGLIRLNKSAG